MADHLIDEVDEALRRERLETFWKRFGQYVITGSVGILLLTVGAVLWQNRQESRHEDWTSSMVKAQTFFNKREYEKSQEPLQHAAAVAEGDLETLTRLWQAQVALKEKQRQRASTWLDEASGHTVYQEYALLLQQAATGETAKETPEVFHFTAQEEEAMRHLEEGRVDQAQAILKTLAEDAMTPQTMRERAKLVLGNLTEVSPHATANTE